VALNAALSDLKTLHCHLRFAVVQSDRVPNLKSQISNPYLHRSLYATR